MAKLQTMSPEFIERCAWAISQVERMVKGNLRDDEDEPTRAPDDVIVMTPEDGIPARDGVTCYGELCDTYRITDSDPSDDEITLEAIEDGNGDPLQVKVFNLVDSAIAGEVYVVTSLLKSGHRYVVVEPC